MPRTIACLVLCLVGLSGTSSTLCAAAGETTTLRVEFKAPKDLIVSFGTLVLASPIAGQTIEYTAEAVSNTLEFEGVTPSQYTLRTRAGFPIVWGRKGRLRFRHAIDVNMTGTKTVKIDLKMHPMSGTIKVPKGYEKGRAYVDLYANDGSGRVCGVQADWRGDEVGAMGTYRFSFPGVPAGDYFLTCRALDYRGSVVIGGGSSYLHRTLSVSGEIKGFKLQLPDDAKYGSLSVRLPKVKRARVPARRRVKPGTIISRTILSLLDKEDNAILLASPRWRCAKKVVLSDSWANPILLEGVPPGIYTLVVTEGDSQSYRSHPIVVKEGEVTEHEVAFVPATRASIVVKGITFAVAERLSIEITVEDADGNVIGTTKNHLAAGLTKVVSSASGGKRIRIKVRGIPEGAARLRISIFGFEDTFAKIDRRFPKTNRPTVVARRKG